jgi:hypothetical protein
MFRSTKATLLAATTVTLLAFGLWVATGRDAYTKLEVVEEIKKPVDPNDPLAGTGFYENDTVTEVVRRPEFRFGLLPTPSGIFDKHIFSVATLTGPAWGFALVALFLRRRQVLRRDGRVRRRAANDFADPTLLQRKENSETCSVCFKPEKGDTKK